MRYKMVLFISCLVISLGGICQSETLSSIPAQLEDGIKTGSVKEVGMSASVIDEVSAKIPSGYFPNIHSLLRSPGIRISNEPLFIM